MCDISTTFIGALGKTDTERYMAYRELCDEAMDEAILSEIRVTTNQCLVLGRERFKDEIESMVARSVRHGHAGRPRKKIEV